MTEQDAKMRDARTGRTVRGLSLRNVVLGCIASLTIPILPVHAQPSSPTAQAPIVQSPTIDRDRVDRQDPSIPRAVQPLRLPQASAAVDAPAANSPEAQVRLTRVRFEGTSLAPELLLRAAAPFANRPIDRDTLQQLANAITTVYAKSDIAFYAVSIPAQAATGGVLTIRVIEGRFASYNITKKTRSTPTHLIGAQLQPLLADKPAHKSRIERTISLLRDVPGQTIQARVLTTQKPDELALDLDVARKQVEVTLNVNNRGVVNVTSGVQAQLGVAINGVLREGDTTRFSAYLPTQPSRYQSYSASHSTPIGANGTTLGFSGAYVRTRTRNPEVRGEAKQAAVVLAHPFIRSYKRNLTATLSLDATNSENYFLDAAFGGFRTRALRLGASWSVVGPKDGYAASASLSQGLDALGAHPTIGYSEKSFRKINVQALGVKQVTKSIAIKATIRAQYTKDDLPTTERFTLGGDGAGIAYRLGVLTADKAAAGDVEVSWKLAGKDADPRSVTAFLYADGAVARSYARPAYLITADNYSLATAGGGVRISPVKGWSASAQVAIPVKRPDQNFGKKPRLLFSLMRTV